MAAVIIRAAKAAAFLLPLAIGTLLFALALRTT